MNKKDTKKITLTSEELNFLVDFMENFLPKPFANKEYNRKINDIYNKLSKEHLKINKKHIKIHRKFNKIKLLLTDNLR